MVVDHGPDPPGSVHRGADSRSRRDARRRARVLTMCSTVSFPRRHGKRRAGAVTERELKNSRQGDRVLQIPRRGEEGKRERTKGEGVQQCVRQGGPSDAV